MSRRLRDLAARRGALVAKAAGERRLLAAQGAALVARDRMLRGALNLVGRVQAHPWWTAAAVAAVIAVRPRRFVPILARGWAVWRGWRAALGWMASRQR